MQTLNRWVIPLYIICLFLACLFLAQKGLDPDFGWHLRMGQLILTKGIPAIDPFSYTMPTYPFVDHEWLSNVILAFLYPSFGINGLTIIFTFLAFLSLFLQFSFSKKKWTVIPLLLCMTIFISSLGIRPQVISWVFFSLLLRLLFDTNLWKKFRFFLPLLFLLWVNMHGGFAIGISVLAIFLITRVFEEKRIVFFDWLVFLFCVAVTFCNPYTYRIWWEVWVSLSDPSLRWSIQEWTPTIFIFNLDLVFLLPLSIFLIFFNRKRFSLIEQALYGVLLLFGLSSLRNLPFWLIAVVPLTTEGFSYCIEKIKKIPYAKERFMNVYTVSLLLVLVCVLWQVGNMVLHTSNNWETFYPKNAVMYLQTHPSSGNIFASYGWGGYLVWKLPEKKDFIDGRMPSWTQPSTSHESGNAFGEYQNIFAEKIPFAQEIQKYNIDTVLVPRDLLNKKINTHFEDLSDNIFHQAKLSTLNFSEYMKQAGMHLVYKDATAVIYRK